MSPAWPLQRNATQGSLWEQEGMRGQKLHLPARRLQEKGASAPFETHGKRHIHTLSIPLIHNHTVIP
jgi:hypothetical protein